MILILDEDLSISAQMLDDASLKRQIEQIAQVLCYIHHENIHAKEIPLNYARLTLKHMSWTKWASQCKDNYKWLLNYAIALCDEHVERFSVETRKDAFTITTSLRVHPMEEVVRWCKDNIPGLPEIEKDNNYHEDLFILRAGYLPVIMPKKYKEMYKKYALYTPDENIRNNAGCLSYQSHYKAKIEKGILSCPRKEFKWTKREPPEFLTVYHECVSHGDMQ